MLEKYQLAQEPPQSLPPYELDRQSNEQKCRRHKRRVFRVVVAFLLLAVLLRHLVLSYKFNLIKENKYLSFLTDTLADGYDDKLPAEYEIGECAEWSEPSKHEHHHDDHPHKGRRHHRPHGPRHPRSKWFSTASLELPVSSDKLFLITQGPISAGAVHISQSNETGDSVKVTAHFQFGRKKALKLADFCLVDTGVDGENGIGLFTRKPNGRRRRRHVGFSLHVEFPRAEGGKVLNIKNFETNTPLFTTHVGDLSTGVQFDSVSLESGILGIHVKNISANSASAKTTLSPIEGNFVVNKSLTIITTISPIKVNATLNHNGEEDEEPTTLGLETSNSPITTHIRLASDSGSGGAFTVDARTSLSPLAISFPSAPVDSKLDLQGTTSFSPVSVHLHPTFEGKFSAETSFSRTAVEFNHNEQDPAGKDRQRKILVDRLGSPKTSGTTEWDEGGKERGNVDLQTSFSPIELFL